MLRITVELIPHGYEDEKEILGKMHIINDGTGTKELGNYKWEVFYGDEKNPIRKGKIKKYDRLYKSVWNLIGKVIKKFLKNRLK